MVISNLKFSKIGGYSRVNFGHLKSEVFQNGGGGAFWSEIPERGFLENLDKNLLFSQKPACASQIVSHILRMWRLITQEGLCGLHRLVQEKKLHRPRKCLSLAQETLTRCF